MSQKDYPVIDEDPTVYKVVKLFRVTDILTIVGCTIGSVGGLSYWNKIQPIPHNNKALIWGGVFGFLGGFMIAYQNGSFRLWGNAENAREVELHKTLPIVESVLDPHLASVAYRNSKNSQTLLSLIPMFNFVNHNKGIPESSAKE